MPKNDRIRLQHMLDAAEEALAFCGNCLHSDFIHNRMLVLALVKELEIIGEAANQVSAEQCQQMPEIPWHAIVGMRNRLVHAYFDINLDILWQTLQQEIPVLIKVLRSYLSDWSAEID